MSEPTLRLVGEESHAPARPVTEAQQLAQSIRDRMKAAYVSTAEARTISDLTEDEARAVESVMQHELQAMQTLDRLIGEREERRGRQ